ncbi:hypothetical protein VTK73DRAFT_3340 [Phialemonium thermophilum]|uniref:Uncharacterized protein n=1 Tax=Phialemonium thermophilum TaxID=223376 RepID=A0ABR3VJ89_9PEZI
MRQFTNPSMAYSELTLPLPCAKELWASRTAEEFKSRYLALYGAGDGRHDDQRLPSLGDLLRDVRLLEAHAARLDAQFAASIYLHGFWALIWEYRQLQAVLRPVAHAPGPPPTTTTTTTTTRRRSRRRETACCSTPRRAASWVSRRWTWSSRASTSTRSTPRAPACHRRRPPARSASGGSGRRT